MMKQLITLLILFLFGTVALAAPGGGKPHKVTSYDYHDYVNSNIYKKTFDRYEGGDPLQEEWRFDYSGQAVVRTEITSVKDSDPVIYTRCAINKYRRTSNASNWLQNNSCDPASDPPLETKFREYDSPVPTLTSEMIPGVAWGSGVVMKISDQTGALPDGYYVDKNELLGIEDITVNDVAYSGCLKIHRLRYTGGNYSRIDWYCPDIGLVKRVQGGQRLMELISFEYN